MVNLPVDVPHYCLGALYSQQMENKVIIHDSIGYHQNRMSIDIHKLLSDEKWIYSCIDFCIVRKDELIVFLTEEINEKQSDVLLDVWLRFGGNNITIHNLIV